MLEHLNAYSELPETANAIPASEGIWTLPYIRFVADALCEDPSDKDKLQTTLWQLDNMSTGEVMDLYDEYRAKLAETVSGQA
jgi:hypothetical protein